MICSQKVLNYFFLQALVISIFKQWNLQYSFYQQFYVFCYIKKISNTVLWIYNCLSYLRSLFFIDCTLQQDIHYTVLASIMLVVLHDSITECMLHEESFNHCKACFLSHVVLSFLQDSLRQVDVISETTFYGMLWKKRFFVVFVLIIIAI